MIDEPSALAPTTRQKPEGKTGQCADERAVAHAIRTPLPDFLDVPPGNFQDNTGGDQVKSGVGQLRDRPASGLSGADDHLDALTTASHLRQLFEGRCLSSGFS
jgi:hypothetical protein